MPRRPKLGVIESEPVGANVIERLEEALEQARAGKISSIALAVVYRDGTNQPSWSDAPSIGLLTGAVSRLEWYLNQVLDGG